MFNEKTVRELLKKVQENKSKSTRPIPPYHPTPTVVQNQAFSLNRKP